MTIFIATGAKAQIRGKVEVVKDPRIDTLIARRSGLKGGKVAATMVYSTSTSSYGYRVQIYSGSTRKEAYDVQARFMALYPTTRTYIMYSEPNYKIRAGDFRTRLEAEKMMRDLRGKFTSLFIIDGKINPPKTDTGND